MARARIIKKYPNRRLYDTEISSYVTLEDVRQLVIDAENFEVHDAKTGQDITRTVLLQIISEREEAGEPLLSASVLQQLIRFNTVNPPGNEGPALDFLRGPLVAAGWEIEEIELRTTGINLIALERPGRRRPDVAGGSDMGDHRSAVAGGVFCAAGPVGHGTPRRRRTDCRRCRAPSPVDDPGPRSGGGS